MAVASSAPFRPNATKQSSEFNPHIAQGNQLLQSVRSLQTDTNLIDADVLSSRITKSIDSMTRQMNRSSKRAPSHRPAAVHSRVSSMDKEKEAKKAVAKTEAKATPKRVGLARSCGAPPPAGTSSFEKACDDTKQYVEDNCSAILWVTGGIVLLLIIVGMCMSQKQHSQAHGIMSLSGGGSDLSVVSGGGPVLSADGSDFSSLSFMSTE